MSISVPTKACEPSCGIAPRIGVVGLAYPGFQLGEEMGEPKLREVLGVLKSEQVELLSSATLVTDEHTAAAVGRELAQGECDCIVALLTTFVPDYFIVELLRHCDKPVFLWALEREIQCLALVCGPMITATLCSLEKPYHLAAGDVDDPGVLRALRAFARGTQMVRQLRQLRVGYCGGKCPIMFSMTSDEYALTRDLGVQVVNIPIEELHMIAGDLDEADAQRLWQQSRKLAGKSNVAPVDGHLSCRYYAAARELADRYELGALSINCFPHLKSKVCLAVSRLNDDGIAAACEGDLYSTILMYLLQSLGGRAAFNGDFLRMYPEHNEIMFSHCGGGALSLARSPEAICFQASIETCSGLAVCYPTVMDGPVSLVNLVSGKEGLRLALLSGEGVDRDSPYEGTPLHVVFQTDVREILQQVARCGAGHHWNGVQGDLAEEFGLLCRLTGMRFSHIA